MKICELILPCLLIALPTSLAIAAPDIFLTRLKLSEQQIQAIEKDLSTSNVKKEEIHNIDVCFMIDCTGSMGPFIEMAKDKIQEIVKKLESQYSNSRVRIAIVGYRDISDNEKAFEVFPFDTNVDAAKEFLSKLYASGGADTPEDVNGGLQKTLYMLEWRSLTRMIYHLADAPCHGRRFHNEFDDYPDGYEGDLDWTRLFKSMKNLDVSYLYFDIQGITEQMFNEFKSIYDSDGVKKNNLLFTRTPLISDSPAYRYVTVPEFATLDAPFEARSGRPEPVAYAFAAYDAPVDGLEYEPAPFFAADEAAPHLADSIAADGLGEIKVGFSPRMKKARLARAAVEIEAATVPVADGGATEGVDKKFVEATVDSALKQQLLNVELYNERNEEK